jgi:hypothetical protein
MSGQLKAALLLGLAIIIVLKFFVVPLRHSVTNKESLLNASLDTYRSRSAMVKAYKEAKAASDEEATKNELLLKSVYEKKKPFIAIQSEVIQTIFDEAEKQKVTLLNFEFPDATIDKEISEVPVQVRFKGSHKGAIGLLKAMETNRMILRCKQFEAQNASPDFLFSALVVAYRIER